MAGIIGALIVSGASEGVDKYRSRRAMKRRATQPTFDEMPISYDEATSSSSYGSSSSSAVSSPGGPESSRMAVNEKERLRNQDRHRRHTVDDVLARDAHDEAPPPPYYPPTYTEHAVSPSSLTPSSSHVNENITSIPTGLPSRVPPPRELGGIQRSDGRKACRVNRDGSCVCGKQQRAKSPGAPEKESEEERMERKRKEMWNIKGGRFWNTMGMGMLRGFVI